MSKILFVAYEFFPLGAGAEIASHRILKEIGKKDIEIDVLTSWDLKSGLRSEKIPGINFIEVPILRKDKINTGFIGMLMFLVLSIFPFIYLTLKNRYSLIHFWALLPSAILAFFNFKRIPYVITFGGADVPGFAKGQFELLHFILTPISKMVARGAKQCFGPSNFSSSYSEKKLGLRKCITIYNGADRSNAKISTAVTTKPLRLVSVSRLVEWKRVDLAVQAVNSIGNVSLDVIGVGPELQKLKDYANDGPAEINFLGFVENSELYKLLPTYDVFILPTIGDSFGIVFTEAMSCGLAVIGARAGGVTEVIDHEVNGFLAEPNDLNDVISVIKKLDEDREMLLKLQNNSIERFNKRFTWDGPIESYYKVYQGYL